MVLYDDKAKLNIEKFDLYNQYRDQICYLKVDNKIFNVVMTSENWQDLTTIVSNEDVKSLKTWFSDIAPDIFGPDKEFYFTDELLELLIDKLKSKFN